MLANHIASDALLDDNIHYRQGLLYLSTQNHLFKYLLGTRYMQSVADMQGNDMDAYIDQINQL